MTLVTAIHWRLRQPRYRLAGSVCEECGRPVFPPRPLCPGCASLIGDKLILSQWDEAAVMLLPMASQSYSDR